MPPTEISAVEQVAPAASKPTCYTFVYRVTDEAAFKPEWERLHALMRGDGGAGFHITAVSNDHEMLRVQMIEEALSSHDDLYDLKEAIEDICESCDVVALAKEGRS